MTTQTERTALYRLYAADGALLYIGITQDLDERWRQHSSRKEWWPQVARRAVSWCVSRSEALRLEAEAIKAEHPLHNVVHTPMHKAISTSCRRPRGSDLFGQVGAALATVEDPVERARAVLEALDAVPDLQAELRRLRQDAVIEMRRTMSIAETAAALDISVPRVSQIVKGISRTAKHGSAAAGRDGSQG